MSAVIRSQCRGLCLASLGAVALCLSARALWAHCDTPEGPVIQTAQRALEKGDAQPVLKWVQGKDEGELKSAFKRAVAVRAKGPEAKQLADQFFLETLVRLHRSGEGAPFTGIKPPGTPVDPLIEAADSALDKGTGAEDLAKALSDEIAKGIKARYQEALEKKKRADESVEAGREYVEAYVQYVHYIEGIHTLATGAARETPAAEHQHEAAHGE